jgi:hypothetical protein
VLASGTGVSEGPSQSIHGLYDGMTRTHPIEQLAQRVFDLPAPLEPHQSIIEAMTAIERQNPQQLAGGWRQPDGPDGVEGHIESSVRASMHAKRRHDRIPTSSAPATPRAPLAHVGRPKA